MVYRRSSRYGRRRFRRGRPLGIRRRRSRFYARRAGRRNYRMMRRRRGTTAVRYRSAKYKNGQIQQMSSKFEWHSYLINSGETPTTNETTTAAEFATKGHQFTLDQAEIAVGGPLYSNFDEYKIRKIVTHYKLIGNIQSQEATAATGSGSRLSGGLKVAIKYDYNDANAGKTYTQLVAGGASQKTLDAAHPEFSIVLKPAVLQYGYVSGVSGASTNGWLPAWNKWIRYADKNVKHYGYKTDGMLDIPVGSKVLKTTKVYVDFRNPNY